MSEDDVITHEKAMELIRDQVGADVAREMQLTECWSIYDWMDEK